MKNRLKIATFLNKIGIQRHIALILTGVHKKEFTPIWRYNRGLWKYIMKLY